MAQVFISYKREEKKFALQVKERVESFGYDVWIDDKLRAGEDWREDIDTGIQGSFALILIISKDALKSKYMVYEFAYAWGLGLKIIPIIKSEGVSEGDFHPRLDKRQHIPFYNIEDVEENYQKLKQRLDDIINSEKLNDNLEKQSFPITKDFPFNYPAILKLKGYSEYTVSSYVRWVARYMKDVAGLSDLNSTNRDEVLSALSVELLKNSLSEAKFRAWLGKLIASGKYQTNTLHVAKAAILNLVELLNGDHQYLDDDVVYKMIRVSEQINFGERKSRNILLTEEQIDKVIQNFDKFGNNENLQSRNAVLIGLSFFLRISEIADAKWDNIIKKNDEQYFIKNDKNFVKIPKFISDAIEEWRKILMINDLYSDNSHMMRRFERLGKITDDSISDNSLRNILKKYGLSLGITNMNPDTLYLSIKNIRKQHGTTAKFTDLIPTNVDY